MFLIFIVSSNLGNILQNFQFGEFEIGVIYWIKLRKKVVNTFRINSRGAVQRDFWLKSSKYVKNYIFFYCWYYSDLWGSNRRLIKMYISNFQVYNCLFWKKPSVVHLHYCCWFYCYLSFEIWYARYPSFQHTKS